MYMNYARLTRKSASIAFMIISLFIMVVLLVIGFNYEGRVAVGFVLIALGFLSESISCLFVFLKCKAFGDKNAFKAEMKTEKPGLFKRYTAIISILTIMFILLIIVGLIIMLV